jgi:flagellar biosynthesis/type III secretory pathway M-ring protein FliF/YscJ
VGSGTQYVVAAHAVIVAALLLYVVVVALRSARIAREAELLARLVEEDRARREAVAQAEPEPVKVDAP